jgi:hypothetical protein
MFKYKYREQGEIKVKVQPNQDKIVVKSWEAFDSFYRLDSRYFEEVKEESKSTLTKKTK